MLKINKFIIAKFPKILIAVILPLGMYYLYKADSGEKTSVKQVKEAPSIENFIKVLNNTWRDEGNKQLTGDYKKLCKSYYQDLDFNRDEFNKCNPVYFNCLLNNWHKNEYSQYSFEKYSYQTLIKDLPNTIELNIVKNQKKYFVSLKKNCHQKELNQNNYFAGDKNVNDLKWDNFQYRILIDKYYVSYLDIYLWAKRKKDFKRLNSIDKTKLYLPATNLKLNEMQNFCNDHKKYLLESRVFDAATFFPADNINSYKFPFPWTKARRSFLNQKTEMTKFNCENAFVKGCEKVHPYFHFGSYSFSWIGITNSLGGEIEAFRNTFMPKANLKLSSKYFDVKSLWHRVGKRGFWDGQEFSRNNFEFMNQYNKKQLEENDEIKGVAFRCMQLL